MSYQGPMSEQSEAGLLEANRAFYAAFEALDLERMSELWARHAPVSCVHPGWDLLIGAADVIESWREIFAGTTAIRFEVDAPQVTFAGNAGWVVCREVLHTHVQGQPVENTLTAINTFVWEDGGWRINHHHAAPRMAGRPRPKAGITQTLH